MDGLKFRYDIPGLWPAVEPVSIDPCHPIFIFQSIWTRQQCMPRELKLLERTSAVRNESGSCTNLHPFRKWSVFHGAAKKRSTKLKANCLI